MTRHQTLDHLVEEATIKPLSATLQRLPPETETEIRIIVQEETERAIAPLRAMLQEIVDDKRAREKAAADRKAAEQKAMEEMRRAQEWVRSPEIQQTLRDCTPPGGRSRLFNRIGRHP